MSDDKLVRMANEIAKFFKPYGEAKAVEGIRHHIASFWTPKMRSTLAARVAAGPVHGLHAFVAAALRGPTGAPNPIEREIAGPATAGEIGASDAG